MVAGECLCGAVRYEIDGELSGIWFCHCSKCRRASGSAFQPGVLGARASFRWLGGEDRIEEYRAPSGYRRVFCRTCGSTLPLFPAGTAYVWLPVGAIEGDPGVRPTHHIHVASKASWFEIADDLPQFPERAPRRR